MIQKEKNKCSKCRLTILSNQSKGDTVMKNSIQSKVLVFVFLMVLLSGCVFISTPTPLQVMNQWDFEDGTAQNWGLLANDQVKESNDIVVSKDVTQGNYSLKISNFDESTDESNARKKLVAVHFDPAQLSTVRHIKADIYFPKDVAALVRYADAKLFLKDSYFTWYDSANGGEGARIDHFSGRWVTVEWDVRVGKKWKDYVGVQIYVKDNFDGPVYIDNVTLYK
jgi:hypothetical protein